MTLELGWHPKPRASSLLPSPSCVTGGCGGCRAGDADGCVEEVAHPARRGSSPALADQDLCTAVDQPASVAPVARRRLRPALRGPPPPAAGRTDASLPPRLFPG